LNLSYLLLAHVLSASFLRPMSSSCLNATVLGTIHSYCSTARSVDAASVRIDQVLVHDVAPVILSRKSVLANTPLSVKVALHHILALKKLPFATFSIIDFITFLNATLRVQPQIETKWVITSF